MAPGTLDGSLGRYVITMINYSLWGGIMDVIVTLSIIVVPVLFLWFGFRLGAMAAWADKAEQARLDRNYLCDYEKCAGHPNEDNYCSFQRRYGYPDEDYDEDYDEPEQIEYDEADPDNEEPTVYYCGTGDKSSASLPQL